MHDQLSVAREAVQRASDTTDEANVREQLDSLDEGLNELTGGDKTEESDPSMETDRLEEVEEKLVGLMDETDDTTTKELEEARDAIDIFRQEHEDFEA